MAIDKKLQIFDDEGNPVDYDILASDVKFNDGKDLPTKLDEMEDEIGEGGYTPPTGGIPKTDLAPAVQQTLDDVANKVDKVTGYGLSKNDYTDTDKAKVDGLKTVATTGSYNDLTDKPTIPTVPTMDATPTIGNTTHMVSSDGVAAAIAQAGGQVTVTTNGDGTFTIHAADDYTINLNHTHENMAKVVKCTEATRPQTLENDTIYVQVNNATTPTEIESLWLFGLEFAGGGAAPGTPRLTSPSQSQISSGIDIGRTTNGTVSYDLKIKARDLTQSLLVEWGSGSTGYSFNTSNLPTGVTYDSGTGKLTITKEAACGINGVNIPVVYTGNDTDEDAEGTIDISSSSGDGINVEVTLVANKTVYEDLAGVKLTGTQWLQTDYCPGPDTEFSMKCKFTENSHTNQSGYDYQYGYFLCCPYDGNYRFSFLNGVAGTNPSTVISYIDNNTENQSSSSTQLQVGSDFTTDNSFLILTKGTSANTLTFLAGGVTSHSVSVPLKTTTMAQPMAIGYLSSQSTIYGVYDLTIYELIISENGVEQRHYVPKMKNGVPGLYDTVTNTFISSETNDELVAIPLT